MSPLQQAVRWDGIPYDKIVWEAVRDFDLLGVAHLLRPMHRTQKLTRDWLLGCGKTGDELLLEALLRRGFLEVAPDNRTAV